VEPLDLATHLSRRARGLPLWFSLAVHGTDRYTAAIEHGIAVARQIAVGIEQRDHLRLVLAPELSVVLFERVGWDMARCSAWSHEMALAGVILCVPTTWHERPVFRLIVVNPATRPDEVLSGQREHPLVPRG
jgi:glutamate/tyrosine decarboxylase-like PLP-dependent enzyme